MCDSASHPETNGWIGRNCERRRAFQAVPLERWGGRARGGGQPRRRRLFSRTSALHPRRVAVPACLRARRHTAKRNGTSQIDGDVLANADKGRERVRLTRRRATRRALARAGLASGGPLPSLRAEWARGTPAFLVRQAAAVPASSHPPAQPFSASAYLVREGVDLLFQRFLFHVGPPPS